MWYWVRIFDLLTALCWNAQERNPSETANDLTTIWDWQRVLSLVTENPICSSLPPLQGNDTHSKAAGCQVPLPCLWSIFAARYERVWWWKCVFANCLTESHFAVFWRCRSALSPRFTDSLLRNKMWLLWCSVVLEAFQHFHRSHPLTYCRRIRLIERALNRRRLTSLVLPI